MGSIGEYMLYTNMADTYQLSDQKSQIVYFTQQLLFCIDGTRNWTAINEKSAVSNPCFQLCIQALYCSYDLKYISL